MENPLRNCPESEKTPWLVGGNENRRSPPVSILEPGIIVLHIPGCVPGIGCRRGISNSETGGGYPGNSPRERHILDILALMTRIVATTFINDRMAGRVDHIAQRGVHIGDLRGFTLRLSDRYQSYVGKSGTTLRRVLL